MKWISVEDRLPKEDGIYEVCFEASELSERCCDRAYFSDKKWVLHPLRFNLNVIYWMPFPKAPEHIT